MKKSFFNIFCSDNKQESLEQFCTVCQALSKSKGSSAMNFYLMIYKTSREDVSLTHKHSSTIKKLQLNSLCQYKREKRKI